MSKGILEKLEEINSKDEFVFKLELNKKVIHEAKLDVPDYAVGIVEDEDLRLYYFFKDMTNKLEEKINEVHKERIWRDANKDLNKNEQQ
jgi:hypothetical protein